MGGLQSYTKDRDRGGNDGSPVVWVIPEKIDCLPRCRVFLDRIMIDDYKISDVVLGHGLNGFVRLAICRKSQREVAVKVFDKKPSTLTHETLGMYRSEIASHLATDHCNIAKIIGIYEERKSLSMVLQFCPGRDLQVVLEDSGFLEERIVAQLAMQMAQTLNYLHSNNIVHRDLKLENWILEMSSLGPKVRLIDFGLATFWDSSLPLLWQQCGSLSYVSPELVGGFGYNHMTDLWSLGVVIYRLLVGVPPFFGTEAQILDRIAKGTYSMKGARWGRISSAAKDFVTGLLCVDATRRMTAEEAILHAWVLDMALPTGRGVETPENTESRRRPFAIEAASPQIRAVAADTWNKRMRLVFHGTGRGAPKSSPNLNISAAWRRTVEFGETSEDAEGSASRPPKKAQTSLGLGRIQRGLSSNLMKFEKKTDVILESLRAFAASSSARKLFLMALAKHLCHPENSESARLFQAFDRESRGTIGLLEFSDALRMRYASSAVTETECLKIFTSIADLSYTPSRSPMFLMCHPERKQEVMETREAEITFTAFVASTIEPKLSLLRDFVRLTFSRLCHNEQAVLTARDMCLCALPAASNFSLDIEAQAASPVDEDGAAVEHLMTDMCAHATMMEPHYHKPPKEAPFFLDFQAFLGVLLRGSCKTV